MGQFEALFDRMVIDPASVAWMPMGNAEVRDILHQYIIWRGMVTEPEEIMAAIREGAYALVHGGREGTPFPYPILFRWNPTPPVSAWEEPC